MSRRISIEAIDTLARIMVQDEVLFDKRQILCAALQVDEYYVALLDKEFKSGVSTAYDFFIKILIHWMDGHRHTKAKVEELTKNLRLCKFIATARRIEKHFGLSDYEDDFKNLTTEECRNSSETISQQCSGNEFETEEVKLNAAKKVSKDFDNQSQGYFSEFCEQLSKRNLKIIQLIDSGSFGKVYEVTSVQNLDSKNYALKAISVGKFMANTMMIKNVGMNYLLKLRSEVKILAELSSASTDHFVRYYDSWYHGPLADHLTNQNKLSRQLSFDQKGRTIPTEDEEKTYLMIKMELCKQDLQQWIRENSVRSLPVINAIIEQILSGLVIVHEHETPIIHRDLKPNNILVAEGNYKGIAPLVKIADFGVSRDYRVDCTMTEGVGAETYRSPEMVTGGKYDCKTDIYSLGLIYLILLYPFANENIRNITILSIREGGEERDNRFEVMRDKLGSAFDVLKLMLEPDHHARPTARDLLTKFNSFAK